MMYCDVADDFVSSEELRRNRPSGSLRDPESSCSAFQHLRGYVVDAWDSLSLSNSELFLVSSESIYCLVQELLDTELIVFSATGRPQFAHLLRAAPGDYLDVGVGLA
jgi:hypothetical protein